jgi:hypothetical protein
LFWLKEVNTSWARLLLGETEKIFPAERNHVGIDAVEKDMLLVLDIISITPGRSQVGELL